MDCLGELRGEADAAGEELIDLAIHGAKAVTDRFIAMVEAPFDDEALAGEEGQA